MSLFYKTKQNKTIQKQKQKQKQKQNKKHTKKQPNNNNIITDYQKKTNPSI